MSTPLVRQDSGMDFPSPRLQAADQIGVITGNVARLMEAHARPLLEGTGVEGSAMRIMGEIVHANPQALRPSKLSTQLHADLSTISRQIRAASDAGLLTILTDPHDRRASLVQLTPHGYQQYHEIRGRRATLLAQLLNGWDDTHITHLLTLLTDLTASMRGSPTPPAGRTPTEEPSDAHLPEENQ